MIPQIIIIILISMNFGLVVASHGEPKEGEYSVINTTISNVIILAILYWGGFFDNILNITE